MGAKKVKNVEKVRQELKRRIEQTLGEIVALLDELDRIEGHEALTLNTDLILKSAQIQYEDIDE